MAPKDREALQGKPQPGTEAVQDRHGSTQLFAMSAEQRRALGAAPLSDSIDPQTPMVPATQPEYPSPRHGDPIAASRSESSTLPPDAAAPVSPAPDALQTLPTTDDGRSAQPESATGFGRLELPPEPLFTAAPVQPRAGGMSQTAQFEAVALDLASQGKRRSRLALSAIALVLLSAGGLVAWKTIGKKLLGGVSLEQVQSLETAVARLRRDDSAAKQLAIDDLNGLLAQSPDWVEARAGLVLALSLQFDDLQQRIFRYSARHSALLEEIAAQEKNKPEGWSERVAVLASRANQLKKSNDTVAEAAAAIKGRLQEADRKLQRSSQGVDEGTPGHLSMVRARAMVKAVFGEAREATALVQTWNKLSPKPDDWVDLVDAESVANSPSDPDRRAQALAAVDAVRKRELNSTFLRPYVLSARIHVGAGEFEAAQNELGTVLNLNKDHDVAQELLEWTQDAAAGPKK